MATAFNGKKKKETVFLYQDERGNAAFEVVRIPPKQFRVRYSDDDGNYVWKAPAKNYPYQLPGILNAPRDEPIYVTEGEKDADTLRALGLTATTMRGGTGNTKLWAPWGVTFQGRIVVVLPDNDDPGRKHAARVVEYLRPYANVVLLLPLPGLPDKGDVTDWLRIKGNTPERFKDLVVDALEKSAWSQANPSGLQPPVVELGDAHEPPRPDEDLDDSFAEQYQPFPLDTLPEALADYADAASKALPCDPVLVALPSLVCCAGAIGNTRYMQIKESWPEPSILWGLCVAGSGSKKTPAFNLAKLPLVQLDCEQAEWNEGAHKRHKAEQWAWQERQGKRAGFDGDDPTDPRPVAPIDRRYCISDITVETVIKEESKNPRGLTLLRDELRGWLQSFGKYSTTGAGGADLAFYLESYQGNLYRYDRKSGDGVSIIVPRCSLSIYGGIQPEVLQRVFTREFFESGFAYRMLLAMPPKRRSRWTDNVIPAKVAERYKAVYKKLVEADAKEVNEPGWKPRPMVFDEEGYKAWVHHHDEIEAMIDDAQGRTEDLLEKLKAIMARLSLVFAQVEAVGRKAPCDIVAGDHVQRAARLVKWFFHETQRIYVMIHQSPEAYELRRVVEWIRSKGGTVSARDLHKSNKSAFPSTQRAKLVLDQLVFQRVGLWRDKPTTAKGGAPTIVFTLLGT